MITCACGCGTQLTRRAKRFAHGHNRRGTRGIMVRKICRCGTSFAGPPSSMAVRVHCSKECQKRRFIYVCEGCGESHEARTCHAGRRFCGDVCRLAWFARAFSGPASPQWRGGAIGNYGPSWDQARDDVRTRDGYRCRDCEIEESALDEQLSVAHVIPFRLFGIVRHAEANRLDNLRSLCRRCHLLFDHANGGRRRLEELLALEQTHEPLF